jgi:hypothetical protein
MTLNWLKLCFWVVYYRLCRFMLNLTLRVSWLSLLGGLLTWFRWWLVVTSHTQTPLQVRFLAWLSNLTFLLLWCAMMACFDVTTFAPRLLLLRLAWPQTIMNNTLNPFLFLHWNLLQAIICTCLKTIISYQFNSLNELLIFLETLQLRRGG